MCPCPLIQPTEQTKKNDIRIPYKKLLLEKRRRIQAQSAPPVPLSSRKLLYLGTSAVPQEKLLGGDANLEALFNRRAVSHREPEQWLLPTLEISKMSIPSVSYSIFYLSLQAWA